MRRFIGWVVALGAACGLLLIPGSTSAASVCPAPGSTVAGALIIAPNTACELDGVTVGGGVSVGKGADLESYDSTIRGSFSAKGANYIELCATPVSGPVGISSTIDGVHIESFCDRGTAASTRLGAGVSLTNNHVGGCVAACVGDGTVTLENMTVTGSVTATDNHTEVDISGNRIGGALICHGNVLVRDLGAINIVSGAQTGQCTAAALAASGGGGGVG